MNVGEQGIANTNASNTLREIQYHDKQAAGANSQSRTSSMAADATIGLEIKKSSDNVGIDESGKTTQKAQVNKEEQLQLPSLKNGGLLIILHPPQDERLIHFRNFEATPCHNSPPRIHWSEALEVA